MFVRLSFAKASEVTQRHAKIRKMANEMETGNFTDVQPFSIICFPFHVTVSHRCGYFLQPLYQSHRSLNASPQCLIYCKYRIWRDTFPGCRLIINCIVINCTFSHQIWIVYFRNEPYLKNFEAGVSLCVVKKYSIRATRYSCKNNDRMRGRFCAVALMLLNILCIFRNFRSNVLFENGEFIWRILTELRKIKCHSEETLLKALCV